MRPSKTGSTSAIAFCGAINEVPYLRLRGDYGSGKTRALLTIGSLCYKGFEHERPITPRWIGSILRKRLNIGTYKSHGVYVVPIGERSKIEMLCKRYGVGIIGGAAQDV